MHSGIREHIPDRSRDNFGVLLAISV